MTRTIPYLRGLWHFPEQHFDLFDLFPVAAPVSCLRKSCTPWKWSNPRRARSLSSRRPHETVRSRRHARLLVSIWQRSFFLVTVPSILTLIRRTRALTAARNDVAARKRGEW